MSGSWSTGGLRRRQEQSVYKYHGYLLATIAVVWITILGFLLRTWLIERKHLSS